MRSNVLPFPEPVAATQALDLTAQSDEDLMIACGRGSEDAFRILVDRYSSKILNLVTRWIGDRHLAEDLTQEVFLRVFTYREKYRRKGRFSSWLYTIAVNLARNKIRNRKRRGSLVAIDTVTGMDEGGTLHIEDENARVEKYTRREDSIRLIHEAMEALPAKYREVLVLRDLQELSYEEITDILGIPGGTVRSRINRARLALKDRLSKIVSPAEISDLAN